MRLLETQIKNFRSNINPFVLTTKGPCAAYPYLSGESELSFSTGSPLEMNPPGSKMQIPDFVKLEKNNIALSQADRHVNLHQCLIWVSVGLG